MEAKDIHKEILPIWAAYPPINSVIINLSFLFYGLNVINCVLSGTIHVALNIERVSHNRTKIVGRIAHTWAGNIYIIHTPTP
jgi:hypothetical protein